MSEKRFKMVEDSNGLYSIFDTEDKEDEPLIYGAEFGTEKIVDLLNEMCETIVEQQSFIGRELLKFDKYLAERLIEKEEIIKEQETIINQLDQKIKDKNEYQQVLESKIRRLKDRIKVLEK